MNTEKQTPINADLPVFFDWLRYDAPAILQSCGWVSFDHDEAWFLDPEIDLDRQRATFKARSRRAYRYENGIAQDLTHESVMPFLVNADLITIEARVDHAGQAPLTVTGRVAAYQDQHPFDQHFETLWAAMLDRFSPVTQVAQPIAVNLQQDADNQPDSIAMPKGKKLEKWIEAYKIICETRDTYQQSYDDLQTDSPAPKMADFRDAIREANLNYSERAILAIINWGDAGYLSPG